MWVLILGAWRLFLMVCWTNGQSVPTRQEAREDQGQMSEEEKLGDWETGKRELLSTDQEAAFVHTEKELQVATVHEQKGTVYTLDKRQTSNSLCVAV